VGPVTPPATPAPRGARPRHGRCSSGRHRRRGGKPCSRDAAG
jgi:hypothetical protein